MDLSKYKRVVEKKKCLAEFAYFVKHYCYIKDQFSHSEILFGLWDKQEEVCKKLQKEELRRIVILKGRQLGLTWLVMAYALWRANFQGYFDILIISEKDTLAREALDRVKFMFDRLPDWMKAKEAKRNERALGFEHHSEIKSIATSEHAGISKTLSLLIIDEAAYVPYANNVYNSAMPTISTSKGQVIALSTANGYGNFFADVYWAAENKENDFTDIFLPWSSNPNRDEKWYEEEYRNAVDKDIFKQEHPSNPREAFVSSGRPVFALEVVDGNLQRLKSVAPEITYIAFNIKGEPEIVSKSSVSVYRMPNKYTYYVIGADVSEGGTTGDYSCAYIRNAANRRVEAVIHGRYDPKTFAKEVEKMAYFYNQALIGIERNAHGYMVLDYILNEAYYPFVYFEEKMDGMTREVTKKPGWFTSRISKPIMIEELAIEIKSESLLCDDVNFWKECSTFIKTDHQRGHGYEASGRNHDDRIMAMAISTQMLKQPHVQESPILKSRVQKEMENARKAEQAENTSGGSGVLL